MVVRVGFRSMWSDRRPRVTASSIAGLLLKMLLKTKSKKLSLNNGVVSRHGCHDEKSPLKILSIDNKDYGRNHRDI